MKKIILSFFALSMVARADVFLLLREEAGNFIANHSLQIIHCKSSIAATIAVGNISKNGMHLLKSSVSGLEPKAARFA